MTGSVNGTADGSLADLRWAVKSNIAVAGWPMSAGSRLVEGYQPAEDAAAVRLLLDAGARLSGSANAEDLGLSASSHTSALGPVRNPWRETHATFGSSSGCAALVSAGLVDFALGADQAGSVRLLSEAFAIPGLSEPVVDETVRATAARWSSSACPSTRAEWTWP